MDENITYVDINEFEDCYMNYFKEGYLMSNWYSGTEGPVYGFEIK